MNCQRNLGNLINFGETATETSGNHNKHIHKQNRRGGRQFQRDWKKKIETNQSTKYKPLFLVYKLLFLLTLVYKLLFL